MATARDCHDSGVEDCVTSKNTCVTVRNASPEFQSCSENTFLQYSLDETSEKADESFRTLLEMNKCEVESLHEEPSNTSPDLTSKLSEFNLLEAAEGSQVASYSRNCKEELKNRQGVLTRENEVFNEPVIPRERLSASPKQTFQNVKCLPADGCMIFCFVLSVWDNIVGPQTLCTWSRKLPSRSGRRQSPEVDSEVYDSDEQKSPASSELQDSGTSNSLFRKGHLSSSFRNTQPGYNFRNREEKCGKAEAKSLNQSCPKAADSGSLGSGLHLGSVVRYVTEHSVGVGDLGSSSDKLTTSLLCVPHQEVIILTARYTVNEESVYVPYCLSLVVPLECKKQFMPLLSVLTSSLLRTATTLRLLLTKHGRDAATDVRKPLLDMCEMLISLKRASIDQYPLMPAGQPPDDRRLAELLLTSHLQTLGSTMVVADSHNEINKVIMWLAQFLMPEDQQISRLCLSSDKSPYYPGLAIQGVVRTSTGELNFSSEALLTSPRPLTIVDLNHGTVRQTAPFNTHMRLSMAALRHELLALWHGLSSARVPTQSLFENVTTISPLVKRFLHDLDLLNSCTQDVRRNFITAFLRSLYYSALALIVWTQHEWKGKPQKKHALKQQLMSVFSMEEADLNLLLAQAEVLQPGFFSSVVN